MRKFKYKLVISESTMNWECLISLGLHPGPPRLSPLFYPVLYARLSFFWLLCPLLPRPQHAVFQAQGVGNHQIISLILINHNLASQLFQTLPLQDPLWGSHPELDLEETHGRDPRPSWTSIYSFFWVNSPSSVPRPVPLRLLNQKAVFVGQAQ